MTLTITGENMYLVRLLTYLPGDRVETATYSARLIYELGQTLAGVHNALQVISTMYMTSPTKPQQSLLTIEWNGYISGLF